MPQSMHMQDLEKVLRAQIFFNHLQLYFLVLAWTAQEDTFVDMSPIYCVL